MNMRTKERNKLWKKSYRNLWQAPIKQPLYNCYTSIIP